MGWHEFLMKHGIGAPGKIARTQARLYKMWKAGMPDATEKDLLKRLYIERARVATQTGGGDAYALYKDKGYVESVYAANPDLLSMIVHICVCEHPEVMGPSAPGDAPMVLLKTVREVLDDEIPNWRESLPEDLAFAEIYFNAVFGDADCQARLASMFENGEMPSDDPQEAERWRFAAADSGDIYSQYIVAQKYEMEQDDTERALHYYLKASKQRAEPGTEDYQLIIDSRAAAGAILIECGEDESQISLGRDLIRSAAQYGSPGAQVIMSELYLAEDGSDRSKVLARAWLEVALRNHSNTAPVKIARLNQLLSVEDQEQARLLAESMLDSNQNLVRSVSYEDGSTIYYNWNLPDSRASES